VISGIAAFRIKNDSASFQQAGIDSTAALTGASATNSFVEQAAQHPSVLFVELHWLRQQVNGRLIAGTPTAIRTRR